VFSLFSLQQRCWVLPEQLIQPRFFSHLMNAKRSPGLASLGRCWRMFTAPSSARCVARCYALTLAHDALTPMGGSQAKQGGSTVSAPNLADWNRNGVIAAHDAKHCSMPSGHTRTIRDRAFYSFRVAEDQFFGFHCESRHIRVPEPTDAWTMERRRSPRGILP
jgi:hypothetical protein